MIPTSRLFQESMPLSRTVFAYLDIVKAGKVLASGLPLVAGTVTTDLDSNTRYAASGIKLTWPQGDGRPPLVVDGRRARIWVGVSSIGVEERVQVGEYLLYDYANDFEGSLDVTLKGMETLVIEDRFIRPRTPPYGASTVDTITKLITESVPDANVVVRCSQDKAITSTAPWEKDRWEAVTDLAVSISAQVYCGHDGRWYIEDLPDLDRLVPVAKVIAGPSGVAIAQSVTASREKVRNAWAVSGQSSDSAVPPVFGFAYDSDPTSPTFYGNPTTQPPATQAAQLILDRWNADLEVWADWTWEYAPTLVLQYAGQLLTAYRASTSPAPGPTQTAWLTSYIASRGGAGTITSTSMVTPPETEAAQAILARMNSGQSLYEDWTWPGAPGVVGEYNDVLLDEYGDPPDDARAAMLIADRMRSGQQVFEDFTWYGYPDVVAQWNDYLGSEFYKTHSGSDWPGNRLQIAAWLDQYALRSAKAFLQQYINDNPPQEETVYGTAPDDVQAAQLILDRLTTGSRIFGDWTWPGAQEVVYDYHSDLLELYREAHKTAAVAWLGTYIGAHGGGGDPTYSGSTFGKVVGFFSSQFFNTDAQCLAYAQRKLARSLALTSQMKLSAGPLPMLEAGDAVQVSDERGNPLPDQLLNQTTLPLDGSTWNAVCVTVGSTGEEAA